METIANQKYLGGKNELAGSSPLSSLRESLARNVGDGWQVAEDTQQTTTRVLVADDHPIAREGIRKLLELEEDLEVVGEASDGVEAIEMIGQLQPDIVLLDLSMPGMDGLATLQTIQQRRWASRIVVLTASEDKSEWVQAMRLGCSGIVVKHSPPQLIVKSIRKVRQGEIWLDSQTTEAIMHSAAMRGKEAGPGSQGRSRPLLSQRELEVVVLVTQGYRNREIAEKLSISQQTVKNHLHNIFDKIGVSDRLELALYAVDKGLHQGWA